MSTFRYPCTEKISVKGFGAFLEGNIGEARQNIRSFADELGGRFDANNITLVNSGSSANLVAAMALAETLRQQGRELEAITSAYTFPTTISALTMAGFSVRVADTEEGGFNLCPQALQKELAQKPASLVCITHFLGFPAQMDKLVPIARKAGALILQDACETLDLRGTDGRQLHQQGDMTTWSFYHPHHLSSYGGGAVISSTPELYRLADSIAHWGRACTCHIDPARCTAPPGCAHNFTYVRTGVNVEMSELNACFGRFQLQHWDEIEVRRKQNYGVLFDHLSDIPALKTYPAPVGNGSPFVFPVACLDETSVAAAERLARHGVECRTLMGGATVEQPAFRHLAHDGNTNARALAARSFFVGIHQTIGLEDIKAVAGLIRQEFEIRKTRRAS